MCDCNDVYIYQAMQFSDNDVSTMPTSHWSRALFLHIIFLLMANNWSNILTEKMSIYC